MGSIESHLTALRSGHPDNPIAESGIGGEWGTRIRSDSGSRADSKHQWLDPIVVLGSWLVASAAGVLVAKALARRFR